MNRGKVMYGVFLVLTVGGLMAAFAEDAASTTDAMHKGELADSAKIWVALTAGFGMALASMVGAWSQARAVVAAVDGIARNPGAANKIFAPTLIIGLALIESLVLFTFVVANSLVKLL